MTRNRNELNTTSPLTARVVCQVLTDVVLGKRIMTRSSTQSWSEIYHGLVPVEIDGWRLTLFNDCDTLTTASTAGRLMAESVHLNSGSATELILSSY
jgi:hypothetical protein